MSDFWEGAGIVAKKALKWAGYGALALGATSLILAIPASILGAALPWATAEGWALSTMIPALTTGALVGGVLGTIKGVSDLPSDLQEINENRTFEQNQKLAIKQKQAALEKYQQAQQQAPAAQAEAGVPAQNVGAAQGQAVVAGK